MLLRSLDVVDFRNLAEGQFHFHPRANLIVGDNGQGKTNLLEAIYFLATTKSFRTPRVSNLVRLDRPGLFVRGAIDKGDVQKSLSVGLQAGQERRRELRVNEQKVTLQKYVTQLPLFAYSASRLEIVRGSPEERRRFLDRGIAALEPGYLQALSRYSRALDQRNALLQKVAARTAAESLLEAWDRELITAAQPVVRSRADYTIRLQRAFREIIDAHHYHVDSLTIDYQPSAFDPASKDSGMEILRRSRRRELGAGFTLFGPHRDSVAFAVGGRPAADILSSGEVKMTVLFLKFAKIELYRSRFDAPPLFLLDDLDAELDMGIMERFIAYLAGSVQLFTTSAKEPLFSLLSLGNHRKFTLDRGALVDQGDVA